MTPPPAPHRLPLPEPDGGWSRSVLRLRDAVVDPDHGGVWKDGALVPEAMLYRWRGPYRGWKGTAPEAPVPLAGRHLWGGTIFFHFGHFLAESLCRLWGAGASGAESILFTPKNLKGKRPEDLVGFQKRVLERLGITLPVRLVYEPLQVEDLILPGQGFGLGAMAPGTEEFRAFARGMDPGGVVTGRKIYISRSALPKKTGSVLGEAAVEAMLSEQGFEIFHPQRHSIDDQLKTFREAAHLLGPDGSAFHLAGFIAQPHQTFTIIKRRSAREYLTFYDQLIGAGAKAHVIDAIVADWVRPGKAKPDDMSWGEMDVARLSQGLMQLGLIDRPLGTTIDWSDELDQIARVHKGEMTRFPATPPEVPVF